MTRRPHRPAPLAAVESKTGERLTRADLTRRSVQLSHLLREAGLVAGDRVAIVMENDLAWFVAMMGIRRAGLFFVPVNWHLKPAEIRYVLENSDARIVISSRTLAPLAAAASRGLPQVIGRLSVDGAAAGFDDLSAALTGRSAIPAADEPDGSAMPYSSGTTGHPKGILRPLSGARFGGENGHESMLNARYGVDAGTVYLSPAPLYHSAPVGFTGAVLMAGGSVVVMSGFDAEEALAAIERYRVTHVQFVPTHLVRLLRLPEPVRARYDLSSLRVVIHAAAPCPPEVKRRTIEWLGPIVHEYYSGSERCGLTAIDSAQWLAHPGSVGRSITGAIHILDPETGAELPAGEIGAIWFEDPVPFEYHKDPAKTAATFNHRGWGTHGDVGHLDEEGYLYLADRRSDLILSGGVNIYPQEVENAVATHPAVADVAVIGVADEEFGQAVKAVVQLLPGASASADAIIAHTRELLAHFKAPKSVDFVDELPRPPNGKLMRRDLVERYATTGCYAGSTAIAP